jgi:hypothetical protein
VSDILCTLNKNAFSSQGKVIASLGLLPWGMLGSPFSFKRYMFWHTELCDKNKHRLCSRLFQNAKKKKNLKNHSDYPNLKMFGVP